jgi:hypothetical protein
MSEPFTREERDALLGRIREAEAALYPAEGPPPPRPQRPRLLDTYYALFGEYSDRLPRVLMSACPFTGAPLKRSIDPYGFDGPWWLKDRTFTPEEPAAPPSFKVLLGAVRLNGREPAEAQGTVLAGPDAPFVVPRLLDLPGMVAVIHRYDLATRDITWPIGYFTEEEIYPGALHQFWTRPELWFKNADGQDLWIFKNDLIDFDLAPWIERGKLKWLKPDAAEPEVIGAESGACPYAGLPGDHLPQVFGGGVRELDELPTGEPAMPFEE